MKKLVYTLVIISFAFSTAIGQDEGDKKVKLGISITPAFNWLASDNTNKVTSDGVVAKMGIGLVADFRLTDVIWFHTGLEYTGAGGKLNYQHNDTAFYYYNNDAIVKVSPADAGSSSSTANSTSTYKKYILQTRNHKVGYIHIPVGFKLKTKQLGAMTYFGQIGGDIFFRTSAKGDDHVKDATSTTTSPFTPTFAESDKTKNDIADAVNFFNAAAHVGAGAEYNISGSTCLMFSVQYRHGIANFTDPSSDALLRYNRTNSGITYSNFANGTKLRSIVITLAVMF